MKPLIITYNKTSYLIPRKKIIQILKELFNLDCNLYGDIELIEAIKKYKLMDKVFLKSISK